MVKLIAEGYYSLNMQVQHYQTFIETNAKSYIFQFTYMYLFFLKI